MLRQAPKFGLGVRDRVTIMTANDLNAFYGQTPLRGGPTIRARVVGALVAAVLPARRAVRFRPAEVLRAP